MPWEDHRALGGLTIILSMVERLFSYGGLVATDHRASLSGEKLDMILFLRENALMANFDLGWL